MNSTALGIGKLDWRARVLEAVRLARIEVIGQADVKNEAQGEALLALLRAYGSNSQGFVYVEPHLAQRAYRPQDLLLCHPHVGVLVVEVKGFRIDSIQRVVAGRLFVRNQGFNEERAAFDQARDAMFDVRHAMEKRLRDPGDLPVFEFTVAFPNISRSEWTAQGFDECIDLARVLFRDDLDSPQRLQSKVELLVEQSKRKLGRIKAIDAHQVNAVREVFGDSEVLHKTREAREVAGETLGAYIDSREAAERNLSREQQDLSREEVKQSPRLVRGVAGSGKTVVLANMAARRIARANHQLSLLEEAGSAARIAVVCFNQALVAFLQDRVERAYAACSPFGSASACPVRATHLMSFLYQLSRSQPAPWTYIPIDVLPGQAERARTYRESLQRFRANHPDAYERLLFDAIFVDEGQDFEGDEYRLLLDLIRPHPKTGEKPICIFYDDAQNVYGKTLPTWIDLGIDVSGRRSRVMRECFRNTRQIVELAFNVLIGSQAPNEVRVTTRTFTNYAQLKSGGLLEERERAVLVHFAERQGDSPRVLAFPNRTAEFARLSGQVRRLIFEQQVRPDDVLVLFERVDHVDQFAKEAAAHIDGKRLKGIRRVHSRSADRETGLLKEGCLTVATTKSAKGYDAPVVLMGAVDEFGLDTRGRASFYVGATRAKYLLFLSGLEKPGTLLSEATSALDALAQYERVQ